MEQETDLTGKQILGRFAFACLMVVYALLVSIAFEPKLSVPASVIEGIAWIERGEVKTLPAMRGEHFLEVSKVIDELDKLEGEMRVLGGLPHPVILIINGDDPLRYHIGEGQIELGMKIAESQGQLIKAVIKAWLLQVAPPEISSSLLRRDVVSDSLLAMIRGDFAVEVPGAETPLLLREPLPWTRVATSFDGMCGSPWRNLELPQLCTKSPRTSPLSFRPLLTGLIWKTFTALPLFERVEFIKAWSESLKVARTGSPTRTLSRGSFSGWQEWILAEYSDLLPLAELPGKDLPLVAQSALAQAGLLPELKPSIDYIVRIEKSEDPDLLSKLEKLAKARHSLAVQVGGEITLFPGRVRLDADELDELSARATLWERCASPSVAEILNAKEKSERVVHLEACPGKKAIDYKPLFRKGLTQFLAANDSLPFVQLRKTALEMAVEKRVLSGKTRVSDLGPAPKGLTRESVNILGLERATWSNSLNAFSVLGAIEAVESYRKPSTEPVL